MTFKCLCKSICNINKTATHFPEVVAVSYNKLYLNLPYVTTNQLA